MNSEGKKINKIACKLLNKLNQENNLLMKIF